MASAEPPIKDRRPAPVNEVNTRPQTLQTKKGTTGSRLRLQANYFRVNSQPDWCLYQYRVDIAPEETRTIYRKALLRTHKAAIGGYIFDGTVLYTSNPLPQPMELNSIRQNDKEPMNITIRLVGDVVKGDYHYSQIYSLLIRKTLEEHLKLQLVGRNYFDATCKIKVPEFKFELWPGYITSIRQHEQSILMCAEISHKVMRDETLLEVLVECLDKNRSNYQRLYQNRVLGCVVLTAYNNRTYRVDDVDFSVNPLSTFKQKDRSEITYAAYYKQKYQIQIRDMRQPLLVSKSKMRERRAGQDELIYLIPELCRSTGISDNMICEFKTMAALARYTRVAPSERINKLMEFNHRLKTQPEVIKDFKEWNLNIDNKLVELEGRVLPEEEIIFGDNKSLAVKDADWTQPLLTTVHLKVGVLNDWVAIVPKRLISAFCSFMTNTIHAAAKCGFKMTKPRIKEIPEDNIDIYSTALAQVTNGSMPQLIFCVVTSNLAMRYALIKKKLCIDRPIPSQVILARTITAKNVITVTSKVATQLNCKIGGIPWTIKLSAFLPGLMIVGYDVCHDKRANASYGAMVASLDQNFGRYFSTVSQHSSGEELSNDLSIQLMRALEEFAKENRNRLPSCILIYRDGVGEGQIPFVYNHEVQEIRKKLAAIYEGRGRFKLGVIIVTKRINTRIFLNKQNPPPGTVVDDVITDPLKYDFFIVSQNVKQGTVAPTAYNVIEDCTGIPPDKLQMVTFKLCHLYFNLASTIRVPAPCQYAHKLAFFASQTLQQSPHKSLQKTLYFL
ncbi:piwi-like protein Siwi [Phymastichus coffea]|uniref:piwi-like protein Siwi n=1 Tax=Phymastichus coffea TaxID=108790 RepID=UPI00273A7B53|nr:piwi-like protein Siwi [Phymastichus coffea]